MSSASPFSILPILVLFSSSSHLRALAIRSQPAHYPSAYNTRRLETSREALGAHHPARLLAAQPNLTRTRLHCRSAATQLHRSNPRISTHQPYQSSRRPSHPCLEVGHLRIQDSFFAPTRSVDRRSYALNIPRPVSQYQHPPRLHPLPHTLHTRHDTTHHDTTRDACFTTSTSTSTPTLTSHQLRHHWAHYPACTYPHRIASHRLAPRPSSSLSLKPKPKPKPTRLDSPSHSLTGCISRIIHLCLQHCPPPLLEYPAREPHSPISIGNFYRLYIPVSRFPPPHPILPTRTLSDLPPHSPPPV